MSYVIGRKIKETDVSITVGFEVLQWTTEPPTVEGWYWGKCKADDDPQIYYITVLQDGIVRAYETDIEGNIDMKLITHWLGSLPIPEPPK